VAGVHAEAPKETNRVYNHHMSVQEPAILAATEVLCFATANTAPVKAVAVAE